MEAPLASGFGAQKILRRSQLLVINNMHYRGFGSCAAFDLNSHEQLSVPERQLEMGDADAYTP